MLEGAVEFLTVLGESLLVVLDLFSGSPGVCASRKSERNRKAESRSSRRISQSLSVLHRGYVIVGFLIHGPGKCRRSRLGQIPRLIRYIRHVPKNVAQLFCYPFLEYLIRRSPPCQIYSFGRVY